MCGGGVGVGWGMWLGKGGVRCEIEFEISYQYMDVWMWYFVLEKFFWYNFPGASNLNANIEMMVGHRPSVVWRILWWFITPVALAVRNCAIPQDKLPGTACYFTRVWNVFCYLKCANFVKLLCAACASWQCCGTSIHRGYWSHMALEIVVNICSCNGLLPNGTKP